MRTAGFGGHGAEDEARASEELPLEGATGMVVLVAGAVDRANRLHSRDVGSTKAGTRFGEEG